MSRKGIADFGISSYRLIKVMYQRLLILIFIFAAVKTDAQQIKKDTLQDGKWIMERDSRIPLLSKKLTEYNESLSRKTRLENGFRLMLLSTSDRSLVMDVRTKLLQNFPDQKVYTTFQSPYIKLKFGNFADREEAEKMKKQLELLKIVAGNIYIVADKIEVKPEKAKEETNVEN